MSKVKGKFIDYDPITLGLNGSGQLTTLSSGSASTSVISTNTTAEKDKLYVITASLTLTLPSSPAVNDKVYFCDLSASSTSIIARNGSKIMGTAEDLTLDKINPGGTLWFSGSTYGWLII